MLETGLFANVTAKDNTRWYGRIDHAGKSSVVGLSLQEIYEGAWGW